MGRQLQHKQDPTRTPHRHPEVSSQSAEPSHALAFSPAHLIHLQRTIGNQATRRLLPRQPGVQPSIQRQTDFGLATSQNVGGFTDKVQAFQQDAANQNKSFLDLAHFAVNTVNDELQMIGVPRVPLNETEDASSLAHFSAASWEMAVNKRLFTASAGPVKVKQLTKHQLGELAHGVYHEARHAEQQFKVAQYLAGKGKSETDIAYELRIPVTIARQAKAKPRTYISPEIESLADFADEATGGKPGNSKGKNAVAAHNEELIQIEAWHQEMPLKDLIYDYSFKIRGALEVIVEEAARRKSGNWNTARLLPAVNVLKNDVIPQFDREIQRVSAQANRSQMLTHLRELRQSCANVVTFVEQQTSRQTLIPELDLIPPNARVIRADLNVAQKHILTEADAYEQGNKVDAALKAKSPRRRQ
jgi:hypothetical protein